MYYEKKYNKLVEAIKVLQETNPSDEGIQNWVNDNVPELADSEDERIRRNIIAALKGVGYYDCDLTNECIAWVEKQGKRDARYKYLEELLEADAIYQMAMNDAMVEEAKTKAIEAISNMAIFELLGLEKQGEKKTIWHNEYEEPQRGSLILLIMQSGNPIVAKIIEPNHTFNHGERWAYIDDLLEKQDDKPAWSEEDEEKFRDVIRLIEQGSPVQSIRDHYNNWLKSLKERYTWKPSDVHISWLEWAIYRMPDTEIGNEAEAELKDLLEQLKKL